MEFHCILKFRALLFISYTYRQDLSYNFDLQLHYLYVSKLPMSNDQQKHTFIFHPPPPNPADLLSSNMTKSMLHVTNKAYEQSTFRITSISWAKYMSSCWKVRQPVPGIQIVECGRKIPHPSPLTKKNEGRLEAGREGKLVPERPFVNNVYSRSLALAPPRIPPPPPPPPIRSIIYGKLMALNTLSNLFSVPMSSNILVK